MKKNKVRLTESQLREVIKESVKKVLKEEYEVMNLVKLIQNNISDEARERIYDYEDEELISDQQLMGLFDPKRRCAYSDDLNLALNDNGELELECSSGMTIIWSAECNPNDNQSIARAAIECINNIPNCY